MGHRAPREIAGGPSGGNGEVVRPFSGGEDILKDLERSKVRK